MSIVLRWVVVACALVCLCQIACATTVQDLVNQVSQASFTSYITDWLYTHSGDNRGPGGPQHDPCARNVFLLMRRDGLTTYYDPFTHNGYYGTNVVGVLQGQTRPQDIYIVSGHYESASNPGADDDASGVAAILEAARVMAKHKFEATVIYIAFDLEEEGMYGGAHYANAHATDNILGMISIDMICYDAGDPFHENMWGQDPLTTALKAAVSSAELTYGPLLKMNDSGAGGNYSDHNPFETVGKPAIMLTEWPKNPYMHLQTDNVDTGYMDYEFGARSTKGVVAYLTQAAGLIQ